MTDFFNEFLANSLGKVTHKLGDTAETYRTSFGKFAQENGGKLEVMETKVEFAKPDPNLNAVADDLSSMISPTYVSIPYKRWTLYFLPLWFVPPPLGPSILVRVLCNGSKQYHLSVSPQKTFDINSILLKVSKPAGEGIQYLLQTYAPQLKVPQVSEEQRKKAESWAAMPQVRAGFPEIDKTMHLKSDSADETKHLFEDWRTRESFLKIEKLISLTYGSQESSVCLLTGTNGSQTDLKIALELSKGLLDRLRQQEIIFSDAPPDRGPKF